ESREFARLEDRLASGPLPEAFDLLDRLTFRVAGENPRAIVRYARSNGSQELDGGPRNRRPMESSLLRRRRRLGPYGAIEIELIPSRIQHLSASTIRRRRRVCV